MQLRRPSSRSLVLATIFAVGIVSQRCRAQDDAPSLGDLARNLRQNKAQQALPPGNGTTVIDNDNLDQIMDDARKARPVREAKTVFSIDPSGNTLKVSSPDVTCSLSFNSRASSVLIRPVLIEDLPLTELLKIDGPGTIQDESLQLEVFNGTDWELREITVGLTLERKPGENAELAVRARVIPAAQGLPIAVERRSDVTLLYHLKAEAKPFSNTAFHENIGITPGPDEDWRWSIVGAKGIRPSQLTVPESLQDPLFGSPLPFASQPVIRTPDQSATTPMVPLEPEKSTPAPPQP